jgi:hypothetical protein
MQFYRWSLKARSVEIIRRHEFADLTIQVIHQWDSRADTFSVMIDLGSGESQLETRSSAKAVKTEVRKRSGLD